MGCHYCECRKEVEGTNRWVIQTRGMRHQCCVSESASELGNVSPSQMRWDLIFKEPIGRGKK